MVTYPQDWQEKNFNDFMKIKRGASPRPIENYITSSPYGVNWIKIGDAPRYKKNIVSSKEKITAYGAAHSVRVIAGDFLLSNSMSFGRPYILGIDGCIHDGWLRLYEFQADANNDFLYYLLSSSYVQKQYETYAAGSGVQNLNKEVVKKVSVFLPYMPEQEVIAETLSSFDTYIDNLTELIEKKRNIRDGALEDLVSRKIRLKEFHDDWIEYSFDDFFTLLSNNTLSRDKLSSIGNIGNIHYGDVLIKYQNCLTNEDEIPYIKEGIDTKSFRQLQAGDIVIADTAEDETVGKAIQICDVSIPVVGGLHTIVCRPNYNTALGYLGYYINSRCYHDQLYPHITGIKVSSISKKAIKTTFLKIPRDIDEQKEIVHIIAAMDEEIKELEKQRDIIIQIREGAMDDLLTGRVRLKIKEANDGNSRCREKIAEQSPALAY